MIFNRYSRIGDKSSYFFLRVFLPGLLILGGTAHKYTPGRQD